MHPQRRIPATLPEKYAPPGQSCDPSRGADGESYVDMQFGSSAAGRVSSYCTESSRRCAAQIITRDAVILGINCASKGAGALVDRRIRIQREIAPSAPDQGSGH